MILLTAIGVTKNDASTKGPLPSRLPSVPKTPTTGKQWSLPQNMSYLTQNVGVFTLPPSANSVLLYCSLLFAQ